MLPMNLALIMSVTPPRTEVVGVDTGGHGAGEKRLKGVWKMCTVIENSGILEVG